MLASLEVLRGKTKINEIVSVPIFRIVLKASKDILRFDVPVDITRLVDIPNSLQSLLGHVEDQTQGHLLWGFLYESLQRWSLQIHEHPLHRSKLYQLGANEAWCPNL